MLIIKKALLYLFLLGSENKNGATDNLTAPLNLITNTLKNNIDWPQLIHLLPFCVYF
jgi:hypothetical protein